MLAKAAIHIHACTDCDGRGGDTTDDGVWWRCEGCDGSGETTSCIECGDPMSRPAADQSGHRCEMCLDGEDRVARERDLVRRFA
jgi:RecJ-like exonuclease